jgi:hypothetical protein
MEKEKEEKIDNEKLIVKPIINFTK